MRSIDCTIVSDGTSDRMLIPAIKWVLDQNFPRIGFNFNHAINFGLDRRKISLTEKICLALELFPCEILFIHRDVEKESIELRLNEIQNAVKGARCELPNALIFVCPKKMSEAWLLIDEDAIRSASGNPNGKTELALPSKKDLEKLTNPKQLLLNLIKKATELSPRRLKGYKTHSAVHRVSQYIEDYSPLYELKAFRTMADQISALDLEFVK